MNMTKRVFLIFDPFRFTKDQIAESLSEEGYEYLFITEPPYFTDEETKQVIKECHEVWLFGNCIGLKSFQLARELNADFWQMG